MLARLDPARPQGQFGEPKDTFTSLARMQSVAPIKIYASIVVVVSAHGSVAAAGATQAAAGLYGVGLWKNSPAREKLLSVNMSSGDAAERTGVLPEIVGTDDLSVAADGVYYFLGDDATNGTTLAGIDLETGDVICQAAVPFRQIGFVGIGQTLDFDFRKGDLVLSGLANNLSAPIGQQVVHKVMRAELGRDCAKMTTVGTFGLAANEPMLHASAIDVDRQLLFINMALDQFGTQAIGVIDLERATIKQVDLEDPSNQPSDLIVVIICHAHVFSARAWNCDLRSGICVQGMVYDHQNKTLVGVLPGDRGLTLHRLNPFSGKWRPAETITGPSFGLLGGNGALPKASQWLVGRR
eukprot:SAG31_NODE_2677_length_5265_cov_15.265196_1_plen_353_part_00